jgi:hypothetical protein
LREWYGRDLDTVLVERKEDLESGDPVRRRRFERKLEELKNAMKEQQGDVVFLRNTVTGLLQVYEAFLMKTFGVRTLQEAAKIPSWKKLVGKEKQ